MRKIICCRLWLLLALLALYFPAAAQDESGYQLRNLTAQQFLDGVLNEVLIDNYFCPFDLNSACHLPRMLVEEVMLRYDQLDVDYATLNQAYDQIVRNARWEDTAAQFWTEQLILAWLRENPTDLSATRHLEFDTFVIDVTPFDADGDGQSEWMLDVDTDERGIQGLLPLLYDGETYRFLPTPLPIERNCCFTDYDVRGWKSINLIAAQDVNGDNHDEIVAFTSASSRYATDNEGHLFVLGLQNGALVDLMAEPLTYTEPAYLTSREPEPPYQTLSHYWRFSTSSKQPEFVQTRKHKDNFDCTSYETRHFSWRSGKFSLTTTDPLEFEDSIGCALRRAQQAAWIGDFKTALEYYDAMLALPLELPPGSSEWLPDFHQQRRAYALIRSALAQAQLGKLDAVQITLENSRQESDDAQIIALADDLLAADNTAFALCQRAYHHFYEQTETYWPIFANDLYEPYGGSYPPPTPLPVPAKAGCDLSLFVETALAGTVWTDGVNPLAHLESLGIQPSDSLEADLNGDATPDWTVWIAPGVDAFVFLSTPHSGYQMRRAAVRTPAEAITVFAQPLPDQTDQALVVVFNQQYGNYYCEGREGSLPILEMWQVTARGIEQQLQAPICELPYALVDLFTPPRELHLGAKLADGRGYETATYHWDAATRTFIPPAMLIVTDDPSLLEQNRVDWHTYSGDTFVDQLAIKPADDVLNTINKRLQNVPDDYATLYERALLLDLMGDHDAALAAYVEVYERFPENWNPYGKLAHLHLTHP
jgi:hypothetical protein